jgi:hypothetical protein
VAESESEAVEGVRQLSGNFITVQSVGLNKLYKGPRFVTNQLEKYQGFFGSIHVPQVAFDDREALQKPQKILKYRTNHSADPNTGDSFNHVLKIRPALSQ